eukprot:TRINITY_DN4682_c0_g1_i1.p1 TRINITY_DN4682_c0_g1~~TRINITY_DN4682_c0_g1_i1.p1  ORF type:complete len:832 (+),score=450.65 TRINITY_DN4682_c0_g1_i1:83-2497(+)
MQSGDPRVSIAQKQRELFEATEGTVRDLEAALSAKEDELRQATESLASLRDDYAFNYNLIQERDEDLQQLEGMLAMHAQRLEEATEETHRSKAAAVQAEEAVRVMQARAAELEQQLESQAAAAAARREEDARAFAERLQEREREAREAEDEIRDEMKRAQDSHGTEERRRESEWLRREDELKAELAALRARDEGQQDRIAQLEQELLEGAEKSRGSERRLAAAESRNQEQQADHERKLRSFQQDAEEERERVRQSEAARKKVEERAAKLQRDIAQSEAARQEELRRFEDFRGEQERLASAHKLKTERLKQELSALKVQADDTAAQERKGREEQDAAVRRHIAEMQQSKKREDDALDAASKLQADLEACRGDLFQAQRAAQHCDVELQAKADMLSARDAELQHLRAQAARAQEEMLEARTAVLSAETAKRELEDRLQDEQHQRQLIEAELRLQLGTAETSLRDEEERRRERDESLATDLSRLKEQLRKSEEMRDRELKERDGTVMQLERMLADASRQQRQTVSAMQPTAELPSAMASAMPAMASAMPAMASAMPSGQAMPSAIRAGRSKHLSFAAPLDLSDTDCPPVSPFGFSDTSPVVQPQAAELQQLRRAKAELEQKNRSILDMVAKLQSDLAQSPTVSAIRRLEEQRSVLEAAVAELKREAAALRAQLMDRDRELEEAKQRASAGDTKSTAMHAVEIAALRQQLADERRRGNLMRALTSSDMLTGDVTTDHLRGAMREAARIREKHDALRSEHKKVLKQNQQLRAKLVQAAQDLQQTFQESEVLRRESAVPRLHAFPSQLFP